MLAPTDFVDYLTGMLRSVLLPALLATAFAPDPGSARAEKLPFFDVEANCNGYGRETFPFARRYAFCTDKEHMAHDSLSYLWPKAPQELQTECLERTERLDTWLRYYSLELCVSSLLPSYQSQGAHRSVRPNGDGPGPQDRAPTPKTGNADPDRRPITAQEMRLADALIEDDRAAAERGGKHAIDWTKARPENRAKLTVCMAFAVRHLKDRNFSGGPTCPEFTPSDQ